ncbi:MAG: multidrug effflux MFS transporter [Chitinophagaceae bacterium]
MPVNKRKTLLLVILGMLSAIGPFSIDMYLPAFSAIASDLHTNVATIAMSLSSFFIGICFGQFLYGPLLDRFGRKKPLYAGITIYLLASVGCALVGSANGLIALRFVQAIGGCAGTVASRAMVRDIFPVGENAKIFSKLMLVIAVSPIIAPTLGGYVTHLIGWHFVFVILAVMSALILLGVHFYLPESRKPDPSFSLKPAPIIKGFWLVLKNRQFYTYSFTGAVSAAGLYAYIAGSPAVFMELFKVSEKQYGWIFATVAMGLIICSQINSILLQRYKSEQIIRVALVMQSITGIVLFTGSLYGRLGLAGTIICCCIVLSCQGFTFPNSSALSMAPFSKNAGSASAMMGGIQMGLGAGTSLLVSILSKKDHSAVPMTVVMVGCSVTSLIILALGRKMIRKTPSIEEAGEDALEMMATS